MKASSTNILAEIHKHTLTKIQKQIRGSEAHETAVNNKATRVKRLLVGEVGTEIDVRTMSAQDMCAMYHDMLSDYRQQSNFVDYAKINKSAIAFWSRVVDICQKQGFTPKAYLQAQFSYFHTTFGTAPLLPQLITEKATERAKAEVKIKGRVVASAVASDFSLSDMFRECDKQVRNICRAQNMTREEFYQKLVVTGEYPLPVAFLNVDPVYQKVANG